MSRVALRDVISIRDTTNGKGFTAVSEILRGAKNKLTQNTSEFVLQTKGTLSFCQIRRKYSQGSYFETKFELFCPELGRLTDE